MENRQRLRLRFVTFLTFVRFPLVLLFFAGAVVYTQYQRTWLFVIAFALLISSAVTDIFDGYFARKFNVVTRFGAHVDPLMDKFFFVVTLPLLVFVAAKNGHMSHAIFLLVLALLFLARDQWVTFLRSIGSIYDVSGSATWSGKLRTCINFPLICTIYHFEESPFQVFNAKFLYAFETVALIINLITLYIYTRRYWSCLCRTAKVETEKRKKGRVQQRLFQAQKMESLIIMATGITHDFNNLLAVILGNIGIVIRGMPQESPARDNAREVETTTLRAIQLADQMAVYSGKGEFAAENVDISALVADMTDLLKVSVPKGIKIEYQIADNLQLIQGNPTQIRQVIINLVTNASDAVMDRDGTITMSTGVMQCDQAYLNETYLNENMAEGEYVYVEVADTGCGIVSEVQAKMFDPFFTTKIRAQGFGLAVVMGVVRAHGGTIRVESEPEKGSTFRVLLPCHSPLRNMC